MPDGRASPQAVVQAYVAAVNVHDFPTALKLMTPAHDRVVRSEVDGLANIVSITDLVMRTPIPERGAGTAAEGYRQVVFVPVQFTLRQRQAMSMPDGPTVWGYLLARNKDTERWLIADEGPV